MGDWYRVAHVNDFELSYDGSSRLHVNVLGRFITIFKYKDVFSAIDSICSHAGGALTNGPIEDIEDLGVPVVLCPLHRYAFTITDGRKAFKSLEFVDGRPINRGWKLGKILQRPHQVELDEERYVNVKLDEIEDEISSDLIAFSEACGAHLSIHPFPPVQRNRKT